MWVHTTSSYSGSVVNASHTGTAGTADGADAVTSTNLDALPNALLTADKSVAAAVLQKQMVLDVLSAKICWN